jgi:hypothetical protein
MSGKFVIFRVTYWDAVGPKVYIFFCLEIVHFDGCGSSYLSMVLHAMLYIDSVASMKIVLVPSSLFMIALDSHMDSGSMSFVAMILVYGPSIGTLHVTCLLDQITW